MGVGAAPGAALRVAAAGAVALCAASSGSSGPVGGAAAGGARFLRALRLGPGRRLFRSGRSAPRLGVGLVLWAVRGLVGLRRGGLPVTAPRASSRSSCSSALSCGGASPPQPPPGRSPCCRWVGFAGSRSLPPAGLSLAAALARSACTAGRGVAVGCAVGCDQAVLSAVQRLPGGWWPCRVFAVGGPDGAGFWSGSLPLSQLRRATGGQSSVTWWAGGAPHVPLVARLSQRSLALVRFLADRPGSGLVALFGSPASLGTLRTGQAAVAAGVPVIAFACGFDPLLLPPLGAGSWVDAHRSGCWRDALRWQPGQAALPLL